VKVQYRDTVGDTFHRDYNGYGGLHYTDRSGRNDIVTCKVAVDARNVSFYAETRAPLTPHTDQNWMLLFIDADRNPGTGWFGYDYLVNRAIVDARTTTVMRYAGKSPTGKWVEVARVPWRASSNRLEVRIPRSVLGLIGDAWTCDFKWADNPSGLTDPIAFCTSGDTAPNRRFNYRCEWKK